MNTKLILLFLLFVGVRASSWADPFDPTNASFDDLAFHVARYGNTEEKRHNKELARAELFARGADSLRCLMTKIHFENVGLQVLAQNFVEQLKKEEVVPVLLDFLDDPHTNTQKTAIYFLGYHDAPERANKIKRYLKNEKLRGVTIRTLGKWKVAEATLDVAKHLTDDNERVRIAAANALRDIGDPRAVPFLVEAQGDPVFTVRNTALRALVSFGAAAEEPMLEGLEDAQGIPLRQLIRGLGELRSAAAEKPLRKLAAVDDPAVRDDARRALAILELERR